MELGAIFVGIAMLVASLSIVARPFREKQSWNGRKPNARLHPEERRKADLSALLDLDFDFRTGKVSEEDYSAVRAQLVADAAQYIRLEKSLEDEHVEAMIEKRKASMAKSQKCSNCDGRFEAGSRFCPQCGTPVGNKCPSCGKPVLDGDHFCTTCGTELELTREPVT